MIRVKVLCWIFNEENTRSHENIDRNYIWKLVIYYVSSTINQIQETKRIMNSHSYNNKCVDVINISLTNLMCNIVFITQYLNPDIEK